MTKKTATTKKKAPLKSQDTQTDCKSCERSPWAVMGLSLAAIIFLLDQASKWCVLNQLMVPPKSLPVTSFFNIVLAWNRGISFGLLSSNHPYSVWVLAFIAITFASVLTLWVWRAANKLTACAFGLILGGAIGNLLDRLRFGAVTDFLDFHAYGYHWYTFNIADSAIVIGVGLIILAYIQEIMSENKK
jgi:signal peptidase II